MSPAAHTSVRTDWPLLIGGECREAVDGATFVVKEPATGEPLVDVSQAGAADLDAALAAATDRIRDRSLATDERHGSRTRPAQGCGAVAGAGRGLRRSPRCEGRDTRSRTPDGRWRRPPTSSSTSPAPPTSTSGQSVPVQDAGLDVVLREPVGVCGLIVPWNFPLLITTWKVAPALACGNPIVIKPASLTPLTALLLGELLVDAGLPAGAVSVRLRAGIDRRQRARRRSPGRQDQLHRRDHHRRRDPACER